jgi:hypothetical protein
MKRAAVVLISLAAILNSANPAKAIVFSLTASAGQDGHSDNPPASHDPGGPPVSASVNGASAIAHPDFSFGVTSFGVTPLDMPSDATAGGLIGYQLIGGKLVFPIPMSLNFIATGSIFVNVLPDTTASAGYHYSIGDSAGGYTASCINEHIPRVLVPRLSAPKLATPVESSLSVG